jgi:hypothetical protein
MGTGAGTFGNYFSARSQALNSLHRSVGHYIDPLIDSFAQMSLVKASLLGAGIALAGAAFQLYPIKAKPSEAQIVERVANSAQFAEMEELCVFRGAKGQVNPELICSPHFDKSRRPGGKLITARLPVIANPQIGPYIPDMSVDEDIQVSAPDEILPVTLQSIAAPPLPEQAPDNLRMIRYENAQMQVEANANASKKAVAKRDRDRPRERCKSRSYWSVKHGECRRKRGR